MRREAGTAHTYYTAFFDTVQNFFFCQIFQTGLLVFDFLILLVVFDHDTVDHGSGSIQMFLDAFYGTGYRCMQRHGNKSACIGNFLSGKNCVTLLYTWNRWSTNVLRKWIDQITLWEILLNRMVFG